MLIKSFALLGLTASLFAGFAAPVLAQVGSKNSCEYFAQNNAAAFAQFCAGERVLPEFDSPILGDDTPPPSDRCAQGIIPTDFPFGARVRVAC